jgi:hypothetical protein
MGIRSRHAERRSAASGSATGSGPRADSRDAEETTTVGSGARSSGSEAAQHVAAPDEVTAPLELSTGESDWCIGHALDSGRASRVAIQLAQRTAWSAESANTRMSAGTRRPRVITLLECGSGMEVSMEVSMDGDTHFA